MGWPPLLFYGHSPSSMKGWSFFFFFFPEVRHRGRAKGSEITVNLTVDRTSRSLFETGNHHFPGPGRHCKATFWLMWRTTNALLRSLRLREGPSTTGAG